MSLVRVDEDIAVAVRRLGFADAHLLMPTVHAADWVGMHGVCQILRHTAITPPQALRVGVVALERFGAALLAHEPLAVAVRHGNNVRAPAVSVAILLPAPPAQVVRACCDARPDRFRDPEAVNE